MEHYYTKNTQTKSEIKNLIYYIKDKEISFKSDNCVFSKNSIDFGSNLLVHTFLENNINGNKRILDVGCGYGTLGISICSFFEDFSLTMIDVNERALSLAKENSNSLKNPSNIFVSDCLDEINDGDLYDYIVTNPPIRAGKTVIYKIYEQSYNHLSKNGELYVVIQKKQGASSSKDKLTEVYGNCEIIEKKSGYQILRSIK
ncbi:MAG: class I SAM-dependent methyltransferase [Lachnospirales bacterium]